MCEDPDKVEMSKVEYSELYSSVKAMVGESEAAVTMLEEIARDIRETLRRRERRRRGSGAATERQKAYLRRLGVEFDQKISFGHAVKLIDETMQREG